MSKDRVEAIVRCIASGKGGELGQMAAEALASINAEIRELQGEADLIRRLSARYAQKPTPQISPSNQPNGAMAPDGYTPKQRSSLVKKAALALVKRGIQEFNTSDVLAQLASDGIRFSIPKPDSAVGTVLKFDKRFQKLQARQYRYVGHNGAGQSPELL